MDNVKLLLLPLNRKIMKYLMSNSFLGLRTKILMNNFKHKSPDKLPSFSALLINNTWRISLSSTQMIIINYYVIDSSKINER